MTKAEIFNKILTTLKSLSDTQIEPYEGQFEAVEEFIIKPPAIFLDVISGGDSKVRAGFSRLDVALYVCTNNLQANPQNPSLLNLIDSIESLMLSARFKEKVNNGFDKIGNFPGFKVYQMKYSISE